MGNKPVKRFSDRLLNVAVWKNKVNGSDAEFHTLSISRGYKKDGEFKSTNSLRPEDIPSVIELLKQAESYIDSVNSGSAEATEEDEEEVL